MLSHNIFILVSSLLLALSSGSSKAEMLKYFFLPESLSAEAKPTGLAFLNSVEQRKKQIVLLATELADLLRKNADEDRHLAESLQKVSAQIDQLKGEGKHHNGQEEFLNKQASLLNDYKQALLTHQEIIKEIPLAIEAHIKVIDISITFLKNKFQKNLKSVYSWKELRDEQALETELSEQIDNEKNKKEHLQRLLSSEKDVIASLQKQIDVKAKERDKMMAALKSATDKTLPLRQQNELLDTEIMLIKEKIALSEKRIDRLSREIESQSDTIELLANKSAAKKELLILIEKRLILDSHDVDLAHAQANNETQKSLVIKEELNKKIDETKLDKAKLEPHLNFLTKKTEETPPSTATSLSDKITRLLLESELAKDQIKMKSIDREVSLLIAKKDLADAQANTKDLFYQTVDLRYKLNHGKQDLDELLVKFKNQKDLETNILKKLQENHKEATKELISANNQLEMIGLRIQQIKNEKRELAPQDTTEYKQVLRFFIEARRNLNEQLQFNNKYLAINADLMNCREKSINQYSLIIQHIENQKLLQGIWKRSPKALSLDEVKRSWAEAETFFAQFFWETPPNLGPAALIKSFKKIDLTILVQLLFFFLFLVISFFATKAILVFFLKKSQLHLSSDSKRIHFLPLSILIAFLEFLQNHFTTIFCWFFLSLHIIFSFNYCFSTISFLKHNYFICLFHLLTIPIFLRLARHLLASLKDLNQRLSYLFFAEKLQDKFILLIACFCYASATFLPLRHAFLVYSFHDAPVFQDVLLAAYSLTLVIVLLLFFSKEDVLRLIPSGRTFWTWLNQRIDQHYYPVFLFFMFLFILSNPYIGYSNLAWFLAFAVPSTTFLVNALFLAHNYVRKYAVFMFMKEDDEEIVDKFEHAKTYYGIFVIFSFLGLFFTSLIFIGRIWGFNYTPADLWKLLSDSWVIQLGSQHKLGFIQLGTVALFIIGGFLTSSLLNRFVLGKLYEILRTEAGTQNTFSKILHYICVGLATCLGFIFIHLDGFLWYIGTMVAVGLGFALKDIMSDYVAGFFVLIERPIEIGSYVRLDHNAEMTGTIHKIDARTTTIVTRLNHSIIIPNKDLVNKVISNWGKGRFAVGFEVRVIVDYNSDTELVKKTIIEVIQANPTILRVPNIIVRLEDFEENALYFLSRAFISSRKVREQWEIAAVIREGLIKTFRQKKIEFAFPQRVIHMGERKFSSFDDDQTKGPIDIKFDKV